MDIAVPYTLVTPGDDIAFNDSGIDRFNQYGPDEYYITDIKGLDGAPLRTPIDNRPQTDGGLVHPFFKGPRLITVEGALMIRSTRVQNSIREIRNQMEHDLRAALDTIYNADGTLSWTIQLADDGPVSYSVTVRNNIPVEYTGIELKTFVFGLVAANPALA
jgi:hypothetical protein